MCLSFPSPDNEAYNILLVGERSNFAINHISTEGCVPNLIEINA
jgi:hypothetical protein